VHSFSRSLANAGLLSFFAFFFTFCREKKMKKHPFDGIE